MANITNPQAILFVNADARIVADLFERLYESAKRCKSIYDSINGNTLFPNDASPIIDGATVISGTADGRKPITGADIRTLMDRIFEFTTDQEANSLAKIASIRRISTNGQSVI